MESYSELINKVLANIQAAAAGDTARGAISTGYPSLDQIDLQLIPGELVIVSGRPGMGVTAFLLNIARNVALIQKVPSLFITCDHSQETLVQRLITIETAVPVERLLRGRPAVEELGQIETYSKLPQAGLFFHDLLPAELDVMISCIDQAVEQHQVRIVFLDHINAICNMISRKRSRDEELSKNTRAISQLSRRLGITFVSGANLNRSVETRGGSKRPILSDLRESGSLEQDADKVVFLYRPEYYKIDCDESGYSTEKMLTVIQAKNRSGICDERNMVFEASTGRITEQDKDFGFLWEKLGIPKPHSPTDDDLNLPF